ncbi:MAG: hypothetical protein JWQ90_2090 [Hydrocarboniphaga sp.]|uniref:DUF2069 domain-containing protein n=1 Tax=Hydrocarboniphaga sp. TaxID=2033016 RepID=UPI00261F32C8|nr:DUF2069 domain-containing protein [Hydrocarboniphaga sp.]MDB5969640.1 hypothetical protein [Hydrocarboniphaga sp.]
MTGFSNNRPLSFYARVVAIAAHLLLILLMLMGSRGGTGALLILPLLLPIAGIIRGRAYTYSWACMLVVFYAAGYLASGYAQPMHKWSAFFLASIAALDFVALVLYVRLLARERPLQST